MYLIIHIIIALVSLVIAGANFINPNSNKLKISYAFASGTLLSGILLIITGGSLAHACISGITFLSIVSLLNEIARRKLATASIRTHQQ